MMDLVTLFEFLRKPTVMAVYAILVALVYWFCDQSIATYFYHQNLRETMPWLNWLTALGAWKLYVLLFAFLIVYFRWIQVDKKSQARTWYLLACVLSVNLLGFVIKIIVSRARPELFLHDQIFGFQWFKLSDAYWSFPSGHTLTIVSLASGLCVLFPRYFYVFMSIAIMVSLSRVVLYYHYLSDVLVTAYASILGVGYLTLYLKQHKASGA